MTTTDLDLDLDTLVLERGSHRGPDSGACLMEAVSWMAGEPWSDHPECASPVLGAFLRSWQDAMDHDDRQQLKLLIPRLVGSRGSAEIEDARAWMALDWLAREHTPAWLRLAGLTDQADLLANLGEFRAGMDVPAIRPTIEAVRKDARAAAGAAARATAWDAARAAAGAAAGDAARAAAWDAARAVAGAVAWDAAWAAAWDAAWAAARAAAGAAAVGSLRPTVERLQASALALVDRMLALTENDA